MWKAGRQNHEDQGQWVCRREDKLEYSQEVSQSVWATIQKYHRLGGLNNKHLFLILLEAGKFKVKALEDLTSAEGLLPHSQMDFAVYSHGRRDDRAL